MRIYVTLQSHYTTKQVYFVTRYFLERIKFSGDFSVYCYFSHSNGLDKKEM